MLVRMDVPVPVLGDVGCDRPGKVLPVEAVVLVIEDVGAVPAQPFRQVAVERARLHEPESPQVVPSDRARHMVNDNMSVITKTQAPGPALEVRPWSVIRQDHGADVIAGRVEYEGPRSRCAASRAVRSRA